MKEILSQNWIGSVVGVVGIIIGAILAYSFRTRSRLAAKTNTLVLVGPNAVLSNEIEFLFRGNKVPKVTLSRIAIWNIGNTTIKGEQIVNSDPLRIIVSEGSSILDTTILNRTRLANDVSCALRKNTENEVEYRFDYLDPGDGALIQLIHTGTDKVQVSGSLRGLPKGVLTVDIAQKDTPPKQPELSPFAAKLMALVFLFLGLAAFVVPIMGTVTPPGQWLIFALVGLMFIAFGLIFLFVVHVPPHALSTQITSNEPTKPFWQTWRK
jgi:hypothetical protein